MDLFRWLERDRGAAPGPRPYVPDGAGVPLVRRGYRFSGRVQGVGFRYEARLTAMRLELTGWARNEYDGTVSVEVQGGRNRVDEFLWEMREVPRFDITDVETRDLSPVDGEVGFRVLY